MKFAALQIIHGSNLPQVGGKPGDHPLQSIFTIVFVTIGSLALLMLVIGGFRYVLSAGSEEKVATAKRTIIYSIVGVIISASALIIVNAVLGYIS